MVFHENTASHGWSSAGSKSCSSAGALPHGSLGSLLGWKCNTPRTPGAPDHPGRHAGSHTDNLVCTHAYICSGTRARAHTDTLYTSQESSGCEVDRFVASGVGGKRNFTTSGGFSGFSHWDGNTAETPNFLFGKYQKDGRALCVRACQAVRENISDSCLKLNLGKK